MQRTHRDWSRTVVECLLWRYRPAVDCCRDRDSGYSRPAYDISPLEEVAMNPSQSHQNLHRTVQTHTWMAKTKAAVHQDSGERSRNPTRNWPKHSPEYPWVSAGGISRRWPTSGLGALSAAVCAWDLLKEVAIISITSTLAWPWSKKREGTSPTHQEKIGLKIYWAWSRPSEQGPISLSDSLSHQKASISLLSSIRGQFSSVQSLSPVRLFVTPRIAASQASLSITNSKSSLRLIHPVSNAIQPS